MPRESSIQVRRSNASVWTSTNPVLDAGEIGLESDTLRVKIGDGTTAWSSLVYLRSGTADVATRVTASGLNRTIYVSSSTPTGMATGDIWIQA
jgi:hypothetical protein